MPLMEPSPEPQHPDIHFAGPWSEHEKRIVAAAVAASVVEASPSPPLGKPWIAVKEPLVKEPDAAGFVYCVSRAGKSNVYVSRSVAGLAAKIVGER
jgi:hypothetical protein